VLSKKDKQHRSVVLKYPEMSGIKLTTILPLLNGQIRAAVTADEPIYSLVICHSFARCADVAEFSESCLTFCDNAVEVINLASGDTKEHLTTLKAEKEEEAKQAHSKVIVSTPSLALKLFQHGALEASACFAVVMDKIELMDALDFTSECIQLSGIFDKHDPSMILTTSGETNTD